MVDVRNPDQAIGENDSLGGEQTTLRAARGDEEDTFRQLCENSADGIMRYDLAGRFLYVNKACAANAGFAQQDMIGKTYRELGFPPDMYEVLERAIAKVVETGMPQREQVAFHGPLGRVIMDWRGVPEFAPDGRCVSVVGINRDITALKEVERRLRESRRILEILLSNLPGMAYRCRNDPEWSMEFVSEGCLELTGYPPEAIIDNRDISYAQMILPEDRAAVWGAVQKSLISKRPYVLDYRIRTAQGEEKWVWEKGRGVYDESGHLIALEGFIMDISELKRTEMALRESEERLMMALDGGKLSVLDWDLPSGKVIWEGWHEQLFGVEIGTFEDNFDRLVNAVHMEDRPAFLDTLERAKASKEPYQHECRVIWPDGSIHWVGLNGVFRCDAAGKPARMVGVAMDITERKQAEEERRTLETQVQHAQKLESLGVLAGGIAHDFNNLLMGILGNADIALNELPATSPARKSIREIETAAKRAADLTRQMLAYSGKGRFVIEPLSLNSLLEEMAHLLEISVSKKVAMKCHFAQDMPMVCGDASQIRQIIMNLITNASESIGDKSGVISIRTGIMHCDRAYLADTCLTEELPEGRYAYFEVSDTGCGMDADTLAKIFDPFFTTKFTGRGLGLAAVLGIVRSHKGAIKVYSEPGRGTTFKVLLPAMEQQTPETQTEDHVGNDLRGSGTILLVDDEEIVRKVGRRMLERAGFQVITAEDGEEAIEVFRVHVNEISCIILDLTMPRMDGGQTFSELQRIRKGTPVILSSGYDEQEVTERFAGKNVAGFIQKPYQGVRLLSKIKEVLGNSQTRCESPD